jgi:hypothetical protein
MLRMLAELIPLNRSLGSLNVYEFGLRTGDNGNRFLGSLNVYKFGFRTVDNNLAKKSFVV